MGTTNINVVIRQTALQTHNTINEILFFITSYNTCYIYPKGKPCPLDSEFKLKVVQYVDNCNNNRQTGLRSSMFQRNKCETDEKLHLTWPRCHE